MKNLLLILLSLLVANAPAADQPAPHVVVVVTSHDAMGDTGKPTGYWLAEVPHPWVRFHDAGYRITAASIAGGAAPMDPRSHDLDDAENARFWNELGGSELMATTVPLASIDAAGVHAIYFAGGHGTVWDFPGNPDIQRLVPAIHANGGVISAVCHGPAALVDIPVDGAQFISGKRVAAFTNSEEDAVGLTEVVPFLLVDRLEQQGAEVVIAPDWTTNVITDGRLVTGQNPGSAAAAADAIIELISP